MFRLCLVCGLEPPVWIREYLIDLLTLGSNTNPGVEVAHILPRGLPETVQNFFVSTVCDEPANCLRQGNVLGFTSSVTTKSAEVLDGSSCRI